jgi:hypothetical protein
LSQTKGLPLEEIPKLFGEDIAIEDINAIDESQVLEIGTARSEDEKVTAAAHIA